MESSLSGCFLVFPVFPEEKPRGDWSRPPSGRALLFLTEVDMRRLMSHVCVFSWMRLFVRAVFDASLALQWVLLCNSSTVGHYGEKLAPGVINNEYNQNEMTSQWTMAAHAEETQNCEGFLRFGYF